jgi:hypothetical protein
MTGMDDEDDGFSRRWNPVEECIETGTGDRVTVSVDTTDVSHQGEPLVLLQADYTYATPDGARAYAAAIVRVADAIDAAR